MNQENMDKESIYTLVGYFISNIKFKDLEGNIYKVASYRIILKERSDSLVAVNIKWHPVVKVWTVFQMVNLENTIEE